MSVRERVRQDRFESIAEEAMVGMLLVAGQLMQRVNAICERHGITHSQYNVLRILAGQPEGHARCDIARRLIDRSPDVTRLVDRLERAGLVERGWSPQNRRLSVAKITAAGRARLDAIKPEMCSLHRELAASLSREDLETLVRISNRLATEG
jgi:DNA-binding MarR family transcriptional regulator